LLLNVTSAIFYQYLDKNMPTTNIIKGAVVIAW
jgi:hypothetical protein